MIVREIMVTDLVTVEPEQSLGYAVQLLRQYPFEQIPVVHTVTTSEQHPSFSIQRTRLHLEGLLSKQRLEEAILQASLSQSAFPDWQERPIHDIMDTTPCCIPPTTTIGMAVRLLMERHIHCLLVVEPPQEQGDKPCVIGLLTRSNLLRLLSQAYGSEDYGVPLEINIPHGGNMTALITTLYHTRKLHIPVHQIITTGTSESASQKAILHLGTIQPAPLLQRLSQAGISVVSPSYPDLIESERIYHSTPALADMPS